VQLVKKIASAILCATSLLWMSSPVRADGSNPFPPGMIIDAGSSVAFAASTYSLSDVDVFSGTMLGEAGGMQMSDISAISQLSDTNALAFDAEAVSEQVRRDVEERRQVEEKRIADAARAQAARAQTQVGPEGCPTSVPPRTLRDGADGIGAFELCISSVASAATPQAAEAVKFVFVNLGVPYSRTDRMGAGYFDCSSYVMRAYEAAGVPTIQDGWAPSTHSIAPYPGHSSYPWLTTVSYSEAQPGDLLLRPPSPTREDGGGHVAMLVASGFMIHTAATGDVSHVASAYSEAELYNVRRVAP
jgi:cell wall-associated NlpC family hydrolase